jgi:hypothetical protein
MTKSPLSRVASVEEKPKSRELMKTQVSSLSQEALVEIF